MPTIQEVMKELSEEELAKLEEGMAAMATKLLELGREKLPDNLRSDIYCEAILRACATMLVSYGEALALKIASRCEDDYEWSSKRREKWAAQMRSGKRSG